MFTIDLSPANHGATAREQSMGSDALHLARPQRVRAIPKGFRVFAPVLVAVTMLMGFSEPAEAARSITPPSGFSCSKYQRTVSISPPRVWASRGTEQVGWSSQIQRWNGRSWYVYSTFDTFSSFNYFGQQVVAWSGGRYHANTLNLSVSHPGYYRVAVGVVGNQGGVRWFGYVARGAYCYVR